jgi:hypothetical protein
MQFGLRSEIRGDLGLIRVLPSEERQGSFHIRAANSAGDVIWQEMASVKALRSESC